MDRFCHGCGAPLDGKSSFCHKCGAKVAQSPVTPAAHSPAPVAPPQPKTQPRTQAAVRQDPSITYKTPILLAGIYRCPECNSALTSGLRICETCRIKFFDPVPYVSAPKLPPQIAAEHSKQPVSEDVPTINQPPTTPAPVAPITTAEPAPVVGQSANVGAIICVVVMELVGNNIAKVHPGSMLAVGIWSVSALVAIHLIFTKNAVNRLVGAIKIIAFATWSFNILYKAYDTHLNGKYMGAGGMVSITFDNGGHYSMTAGGDTTTGSYTLTGSTLTLDPTAGGAQEAGVKDDPMYQALMSNFTGRVSEDRQSITMMGQQLTHAE